MSLKQHLMSLASVRYTIISKKRMKDRGLNAIGPFLMPEMIRMPRRPQTPCRYPGCPKLVPYGRKYCDEHEWQCQGERKSAVLRGYGREWQKARKFSLVHPLQRKGTARPGNRRGSYQAPSRRPGFVLG